MNITTLKERKKSYEKLKKEFESFKQHTFSEVEAVLSLYWDVYSDKSPKRENYVKYCKEVGKKQIVSTEEILDDFMHEVDVPAYYEELLNFIVKEDYLLVEVLCNDRDGMWKHEFFIPIEHFEDDGLFLQNTLDSWEKEIKAYYDEQERVKYEKKMTRKRKQLEKLKLELGE